MRTNYKKLYSKFLFNKMNKGVFILPHEQHRFIKSGNGLYFKYKKPLTFRTPYNHEKECTSRVNEVIKKECVNDVTKGSAKKVKKDREEPTLKAAHELSFKLGKGFKIF